MVDGAERCYCFRTNARSFVFLCYYYVSNIDGIWVYSRHLIQPRRAPGPTRPNPGRKGAGARQDRSCFRIRLCGARGSGRALARLPPGNLRRLP